MKKILKVFLVFIFMMMLTGCVSDGKTITEISYSELEEMIDSKDSFILEIIQTGCSHCEEFTPRFTAMLKTNDLTAYSLNLYNLSEEDRDKFDDLTNVSGTPTVLFFEDGEEISTRISGAVSNNKIEDYLQEAGYIEEK